MSPRSPFKRKQGRKLGRKEKDRQAGRQTGCSKKKKKKLSRKAYKFALYRNILADIILEKDPTDS